MMSIPQRVLIQMIKFYRRHISAHTSPSCIYYPTCSAYGIEALKKHGAFKGSLMTIARVLRCHPFHKGGVDRVPEHFSLSRNPKDLDKVYLESLGVFDRSDLDDRPENK